MNWVVDQKILAKYGERVLIGDERYKVFTNAAGEPSLSINLFGTWVHVETFTSTGEAIEFAQSLDEEFKVEEAS